MISGPQTVNLSLAMFYLYLRKFLRTSCLAVFFLTQAAFSSQETQLDLDLAYIGYAETEPNLSKNHLDLKLGAHYKKEAETYDLYFSLYAQAATYFDYVAGAPEAYISFKSGESRFSFGRKSPLSLLDIDSYWSLGLDQAHLRFNPFEPIPQGRLAGFYTYRSESIDIEAFASPASIPDQGARYKYKNGSISSKNPWAQLPPTKLSIEGGESFNLNYEVIDDNLPDLILDPQYGVSFDIKTDYLKVTALYTNKPSKQLGFELIEPGLSGQVGVVDVSARPIFIREHLFAVQIQTDWLEGLRTTNAFQGVAIDSSELDQSIEYRTKVSDYFFVTTKIDFSWSKNQISLGHLYKRERPFDASGVIYFDNNRFLHGNAFKLKYSSQIKSGLNAGTEILYGAEEKGLSAIFNLSKSFKKNFSVYAQLHLIKSFEKGVAENKNSFSRSNFSAFSHLDNIRVGVAYVL